MPTVPVPVTCYGSNYLFGVGYNFLHVLIRLERFNKLVQLFQIFARKRGCCCRLIAVSRWFFPERPRSGAVGGKISAIFCEQVLYPSRRPIPAVGKRLDKQGNTARSVSFVHDSLKGATAFPRLFYRAFNVVARHIFLPRALYCRAKRRRVPISLGGSRFIGDEFCVL